MPDLSNQDTENAGLALPGSASGPCPHIRDIVRQHVETAAFLSVQYDAAERNLPSQDAERDLIARRLRAQLDGVRLAGQAGLAIAGAQADDYPEPGEIFVVAWAALQTGAPSRIGAAFDRVAAAPAALAGLLCAIGRVPKATLSPHVQTWLNAASWVARVAGLHACRRHGQDPGALLERLLSDPDSRVRAEAARLAARLGRREAVAPLTALLADAEAATRFAAALALAELGETDAAATALRALAGAGDHLAALPSAGDELAAPALDRAVILSPRAVLEDWVRDLRDDPATRPVAIRAVGILGDPVCWPWLFAQMDDPAMAVAAGMAACDLLGCAPEATGLFRPGPDIDDLPVRALFEAAHNAGRLKPVEPDARSERARMLAHLRDTCRRPAGG